MSSSKKFNCKWTLRQVFIKVYGLEIHSVMLVFSTQLCELLPLLPSLWFNSSPSSLVNKYTVNMYTVCKGVLLETIFCRSLTLCIWPDSEPTKLLHHPKQNPRRWGAFDR
jgi:hypothetical protein